MGLFRKKKAAKVEQPRAAVLPSLTIPPEGGESIIVVATEYYPAVAQRLPKRGTFQVVLEREPNNKYDPGAVAVKYGGRVFGYLSEFRASKYGPIMDAIGTTFTVECRQSEGRHYVILPKPLDLAKQLGPATTHLLDDLGPRKSFFLKGGPKYYEQTGQLLTELGPVQVTAAIIADTLPTGKWAGGPRYRFWVGERCIGEATARYLEGNEWLFDLLATGITQIDVQLGNHEDHGPWARLTEIRDEPARANDTTWP